MVHQACWEAHEDGERACDACEAILDAYYGDTEIEPGIMLEEPELEMSGAELVAEHRGEIELLP